MLYFCIHLLVVRNVEILFGDSWSYVFFGAQLRLRTFYFMGDFNMSLKTNIKKMVQKQRRRRLSKLDLKQKDVTILSNFCIGGAIYNDLGLQFLSPTINLFFGHHGFIDFVNNLKEYKNAELIDTGNYDNYNGKKTPICILRKKGFPDVEIHFTSHMRKQKKSGLADMTES